MQVLPSHDIIATILISIIILGCCDVSTSFTVPIEIHTSKTSPTTTTTATLRITKQHQLLNFMNTRTSFLTALNDAENTPPPRSRLLSKNQTIFKKRKTIKSNQISEFTIDAVKDGDTYYENDDDDEYYENDNDDDDGSLIENYENDDDEYIEIGRAHV